jgi:hypothetical protein
VIAVGRDFERMQDYIVGRLSDNERRAFEDRLVREPALVRELEESLQLREGLEQLRAKGYTPGALSRFRSARFWPVLAAAVIAGLALFLSWQRQIEPPSILAESVSADVTPLDAQAGLTFRRMRGDDGALTLSLPPPRMIPLRIAPARPRADSRYHLILNRLDTAGSARTIGVLSAMALGPDGFVHCFVDASRLTAGSYALHIEREGAETDPADFRFNLKAAGNPPSQ